MDKDLVNNSSPKQTKVLLVRALVGRVKSSRKEDFDFLIYLFIH